MSHTPGPWRIALDQERAHPDFYPICSEPRSVEVARCEELADAVLVAAAPELLKACKAMHQALDMLLAQRIAESPREATFMPTQSPAWPAVVQGNAAIKQAEGRS